MQWITYSNNAEQILQNWGYKKEQYKILTWKKMIEAIENNESFRDKYKAIIVKNKFKKISESKTANIERQESEKSTNSLIASRISSFIKLNVIYGLEIFFEIEEEISKQTYGEHLYYELERANVTDNMKVGLFFLVNDEFITHEINIKNAIMYGRNLTLDKSHYDVWQEQGYQKKYKVDYDYYPRGRYVFNVEENQYIVYADRCAEEKIKGINGKVRVEYDEHYICHNCNDAYVDIFQ